MSSPDPKKLVDDIAQKLVQLYELSSDLPEKDRQLLKLATHNYNRFLSSLLTDEEQEELEIMGPVPVEAGVVDSQRVI